MKYIVLKFKTGGIEREFPIIFPDALIHAEVANAISEVITETLAPRAKPIAVSAGEISSMSLAYCTPHGKSDTLKLQSRGKIDEELISNLDYNHGIADT